MSNAPLIIFTVLEGMTVGAFITMVVMQWIGKLDKEKGTAFKLSLLIFILAAVGMLVSLLHLGQPFRAVTALAGLGHSWLSREILFMGLFALFVLIYCICAKMGKEGALKGLGIAGAILGFIAVVCTSLCYMLPGVPAWDSILTPTRFIIGMAATGFTFAFSFSQLFEKKPKAGVWIAIFAIVLILVCLSRCFFYSNIVLLVNAL